MIDHGWNKWKKYLVNGDSPNALSRIVIEWEWLPGIPIPLSFTENIISVAEGS